MKRTFFFFREGEAGERSGEGGGVRIRGHLDHRLPILKLLSTKVKLQGS